jgi:deoxyadenosine/deoxycytidine kinase
MVLVTLEGNIGAGKTTFLRRVDAALAAAGIAHVVLYEPVDVWTSTRVEGRSMLERFYEDKAGHALAFQFFVLQTRVQQMLECLREHPGKVIVTERCHVTDCRIFARLMQASGYLKPHEMLVYTRWYDTVCGLLSQYLQGIVYLRASPSVCVQRIIQRARRGEETITLEYIKRLHDAHESWILAADGGEGDSGPGHGVAVQVVDGDADEAAVDADAVVRFVAGLLPPQPQLEPAAAEAQRQQKPTAHAQVAACPLHPAAAAVDTHKDASAKADRGRASAAVEGPPHPAAASAASDELRALMATLQQTLHRLELLEARLEQQPGGSSHGGQGAAKGQR